MPKDNNNEIVKKEIGDGCEWERSNLDGQEYKFNLNDKNTERGSHFNWSELSKEKSLTASDDFEEFFTKYNGKSACDWNTIDASDSENYDVWSKYGEEFLNRAGFTDGVTKLEAGMSTYKAAELMTTVISERLNKGLDKSVVDRNEYNEQIADKSANGKHKISEYSAKQTTYKDKTKAEAEIQKYSPYGATFAKCVTTVPVDPANNKYEYRVTIGADLQCSYENDRMSDKERDKLAKEQKSNYDKNNKALDKAEKTNVKNIKNFSKKRIQAIVNEFKDSASSNDIKRLKMIKLEKQKQELEDAQNALEADRQAALDAADSSANAYEQELISQGYSAEDAKALSDEYRAAEKEKAAAKWDKINSKKVSKLKDKENKLNVEAENATQVSSAMDLEESSAGKNKKSWFASLAGAISKGLSIAGAVGDFIKNPSLSNLLSKFGLSNSKLLNALTKNIKSSFLNGLISDLYNAASTYIDGALQNAMALGLSYLYGATSEYLDEQLVNAAKSMIVSGADINYNNDYLKYILECDLPKSLAFLDSVNNIGENDPYYVGTPEESRGIKAAKNGCCKVSKYVADKLFISYKAAATVTADGNMTNPDVANRTAKAIKRIFKETVVNSYSNFNVNELKKWLTDFAWKNAPGGNLIIPCMLGGDIYDNGRNVITKADLDIMAPIRNFGEISRDKIVDKHKDFKWVSPSSAEDFQIDKDCIDLRNNYIKDIYIYLVSNGAAKCDKLTNKEFHDRLKYPVLTYLAEQYNNSLKNLNNSGLNKWAKVAKGVAAQSFSYLLKTMDAGGLMIRVSQTNFKLYKDNTSNVPEFKDNTIIDIFYTDNSTLYSEVPRTVVIETNAGKKTKLSPVFEDIDSDDPNKIWRVTGWSKTSNGSADYSTADSITSNVSVTLYAVWSLVSKDDAVDNIDSDLDDNDITNNITEEELNKRVDEIFSSVPTIEAINKCGLTVNDFVAVNSYGLTSTKLSEAIKKYTDDGFTHVNTTKSTIKRFNDVEGYYSEDHTYYILCKNATKFNEANLSDNDKVSIYYDTVARYLIQKYAKDTSITTLCGFYGTSIENISYSLDSEGNAVLDPEGNKIISSRTYTNTNDAQLADAINRYSSVYDSIANLIISSVSSNKICTVKFDLCGFSKDAPSSFKVKANSNISAYKPDDPEEDGFVFKGWGIDPNGEQLWNFDTNKVSSNITLYAIWVKSECYMKRIWITRAKNSLLTSDIVFGTVDDANERIIFSIHENEIDTDNKFVIYYEIPEGCKSDTPQGSNINFTTGEIVLSSGDSTKYYEIELQTLSENFNSVSFVSDGGVISAKYEHVADPLLYLTRCDRHVERSVFPTVEKPGYKFLGWYKRGDSTKTIVDKFTSNERNITFEALLEEIAYNISYYDRYDYEFSGTHESNYPSTFKPSKAVILDKPVKDGYKFISYHADSDCVTEEISVLYRYKNYNDLKLYTYWMDKAEYEAITGGTNINGSTIYLKDLVFYPKYVMADGNRWATGSTGLVIYGSNGSKISDVIVAGKGYSIEGITTVKGNDGKSIFLAVARSRNQNKVYVYYSLDRGANWSRLMECTSLILKYADVTGFESVNYITFYLSVLYNGHLYSVVKNDDNNLTKIVIDGENTLLSDTTTGLSITAGKRILGIAVCIDGTMYALIENVGVIAIKNFVPNFDADGNFVSLNNIMYCIGIAGWVDGIYNIDRTNIGTVFNIVGINPDIDTDYDIDDPDAVESVMSFYKDKFKYVRTYAKIGDADDPVRDIDWIWAYDYAKSGVILSERAFVVENFNNFRPTINKPIKMVQLEDVSKNKTKSFENIPDPEDIRLVTIDYKNYEKYIGWTRIIYDTDGKTILEKVKITHQYLAENGISDGTITGSWYVNYNRSELKIKEIATATGDKITVEVYNAPDIEPSSVFTKYLKYGKY